VLRIINRIGAITIAAAIVAGCTTAKSVQPPPKRYAWVRIDGRLASKDPALLAKLRTDAAECRTEVVKATGAQPEKVTGFQMEPCMQARGYRLTTLAPDASFVPL